jgi:hypothetical protein
VLVQITATRLSAAEKGYAYNSGQVTRPGDSEFAVEWQYVGNIIDAWFDNDPESPFTWEFQLLPTGKYAE